MTAITLRPVDVDNMNDVYISHLFRADAYLVNKQRIPAKMGIASYLMLIRQRAKHMPGTLGFFEMDGQPIGQYETSSGGWVEAHIDLMYLIPAVRRQGLGRRALQQLCDMLYTKNYDSASLYSQIKIPGNTAFYESCGWTNHGPTSVLEGSYMWGKEIGPSRFERPKMKWELIRAKH